MRVCFWHGWLLDGTGSNVYTAKAAEAMRRAGHDVLLVAQEPHPERLGWVDAHGEVDGTGVRDLVELPAAGAAGRTVVLRPAIGELLPVFVLDGYEGFRAERFVDLTDEELETYLDRNVVALRAAVEWHGSEAVIAGHAVPGPVVARRALGPGRYSAKVHGSDLEYAIRIQERYAALAREGLEGAVAVTGATDDVLARTTGVVPAIAGRVRRVPPGVDVDLFRPRARREALLEVAAALGADPGRARGRPPELDDELAAAVAGRDPVAVEALTNRYDQWSPDAEAPARIRALASIDGPLVGYVGKLIVQKGVERILEARALAADHGRTVVVGFGGAREWLEALAAALRRGDVPAHGWIREGSGMRLELSADEVRAAAGAPPPVFTGRLDHRYAPGVLAALDVLAVPSTLAEAFGIVAAEGAACGALPLVARHSGLAEVATTLESAVGRPGLFSFEPGDGATRRLARGLRALLDLPGREREDLRAAVAATARSEWTWERTAERLLEAATAAPH